MEHDAVYTDYENAYAEDQTQEWLLGSPPDQPRWVVDTDEKAEWLIRKMLASRGETNRQVMTCREIIAKYQRRIEDLNRQQENRDGGIMVMLRHYFDTQPHRVLKASEVYDLPTARLRLKLYEPEKVRDDAKLLKHLKDNKFYDFIETVEKPKWGEFNKTLKTITLEDGTFVFDQDGNKVDGVTLKDRDPKFEMEVL